MTERRTALTTALPHSQDNNNDDVEDYNNDILRLHTGDVALYDSHLVGSQRSRFVAAYRRCVAHRFTRVQMSHQVVVSHHLLQRQQQQSGIGRVRALADISRSGYVVIATKPVHQLQIRPIVHNHWAPHTIPKLHPDPCSSVGMRRGTDTQTDRQAHTQTHIDARDQYTFRIVYVSHEM